MHRSRAVALVICVLLGTTAVTVGGAASTTGVNQSATASDVGPGDRLQGIVGVHSAEVDGEFETRRFSIAVSAADSNDSAATVVAGQVSSLRTRLEQLEERQAALERARENGSLAAGEVSAELAIVAARTAALRQVANRTEVAARGLPAALLEDRGVNVSAIRRLRDRAANLTGPEVAAIARSIAGRSAGRALAAGNRSPVRPPAANRSNAGSRDDQGPGGADRSNRSTDTGNRSAARGSGSILDAVGRLPARLGGLLDGALAAASSPLVGTASAQTDTTDRPLFEVVLDRDGNARVTLVLTFDLTSDTDKRAFETLIDDQEAQRDVRNRFLSRMRSVANQSERITDRAMRVDDARINLTRSADGSVGVVATSIDWAGLAAVEDGHLVITEPFASGFTPDREFRVRITAPGGYSVTTARPDPADRGESTVGWAAGTDLSGFILAFSPEGRTPLPETVIEGFQSTLTVEDPVGGSGTGLPGFGPLVAIIALLAAALLAAARR